MKQDSSQQCPCGSGQSYAECCQIFHQGQLAPTPLQLMRSRYSAYAKRLPDYIMKTTHPQNPSAQVESKQWRKIILQFCDQTTFKKLEILDYSEIGMKGTVTFKAYLARSGTDYSYIEKSGFEKVEGAWLYLSGEIYA